MCVLRRPSGPRWHHRRRTHGFSTGGPELEARDVRNRRDPKVTAVSHRGLYGRTSGRSTGSNGFVTLSRSAPSAGWRPRAAGGRVRRRSRVRREPAASRPAPGRAARSGPRRSTRGRARVAGQPEIRERGQREVRRTTDPGLEHPPAPHGTPSSDATSCTRLASRSPPTRPCLMFTIRHARARSPPGRPQPSGSTRPTDIGPDLPLELRVLPQILVMQRLLDHQQPERIEPPEDCDVCEPIGGVRVHREQDLGVRLPNRADAFDVGARLDLELDAAVTLGEVARDLLEQRVGRGRSRPRRRTRPGRAPLPGRRRGNGPALGARRRAPRSRAWPWPSGVHGRTRAPRRRARPRRHPRRTTRVRGSRGSSARPRRSTLRRSWARRRSRTPPTQPRRRSPRRRGCRPSRWTRRAGPERPDQRDRDQAKLDRTDPRHRGRPPPARTRSSRKRGRTPPRSSRRETGLDRLGRRVTPRRRAVGILGQPCVVARDRDNGPAPGRRMDVARPPAVVLERRLVRAHVLGPGSRSRFHRTVNRSLRSPAFTSSTIAP